MSVPRAAPRLVGTIWLRGEVDAGDARAQVLRALGAADAGADDERLYIHHHRRTVGFGTHLWISVERALLGAETRLVDVALGLIRATSNDVAVEPIGALPVEHEPLSDPFVWLLLTRGGAAYLVREREAPRDVDRPVLVLDETPAHMRPVGIPERGASPRVRAP